MPFIEFNDIETFVGSESSLLKDLLLSLGGVVVGFVLAELASLYRKWNEKQKIGKSFDFEISALKDPLKNQINGIKDLKTAIEKYEEHSPSLFIYKNLEFVKSLDRNIVSEYFKSKHGEDNLKKTRVVYNTLSVIEAEMDRYNKFYEEFNVKLSSNYNLYRMNLTGYSRCLTNFDLSNQSIDNKDPYVVPIINLFKKYVFTGNGISNIMPFENDLHLPIVSLNIKSHGHPFYNDSSHYNQTALDIIMSVKIDTESFIGKLENIEKSLENCYAKIYQETTTAESSIIGKWDKFKAGLSSVKNIFGKK